MPASFTTHARRRSGLRRSAFRRASGCGRDAQDLRQSAVSTAALATRVFGWFAAWLVVATAGSLLLIPDSSDPNIRDAEDWLLLPLMLAVVGAAAGLATAVAGCICVVRREPMDVRTVAPLVAGTGTTFLPVLWVAAALLRR